MTATSGPSIVFEAQLLGPNPWAKIYNPLFPDMCIEADLELLQDIKCLMGLDPEVEIRNILRAEYKAKYGI